MEQGLLKDITIRRLNNNEAVPYELLLTADPSIACIESYIKSSEIYVAILKAKVIATFVLYPSGADIYEIKNIAVKEQYQGKGIGKLLLNKATDIAIAKNAGKLVIGTSNSSVAQLYVYQRNGFELTHIIHNFFLDNYTEPIFENGIQCKHMIVLEKKLG